jgi:hypothetical protein
MLRVKTSVDGENMIEELKMDWKTRANKKRTKIIKFR